MTLQGHQDMITGMQLSPDGSCLLTNGMNCKLCIWDMRPYVPQNLCVKAMEGHQHNFEKNLLKCSWSLDGSKVTARSSDRMVYIWDTSRRILYKLPGHTGSVSECVFHPSEPVVGSCSNDKQIYLGRFENQTYRTCALVTVFQPTVGSLRTFKDFEKVVSLL